VKNALGFLMTREIAHQLSFEKALHSIQSDFSQVSIADFHQLIGTTAISFEREAQRISKQTLPVAPRASRKRSSGK
jgi:Mn-containing catalase